MANKSKRSQKSSSSQSRTGGQRSRRSGSIPFYSDVIGLAGGLLRNRQESGAEKIDTMAQATRNFAGDFDSIPHIQSYMSAAADQLETLADYVAESSLENMVEDAGTFTKRHPMATMAFAVAAGFAFTRMFTSNSSSQRSSSDDGPPKTRRNQAGSAASAGRARSASSRKVKANGRDTSHASANAS
jgi:hypothetical protein